MQAQGFYFLMPSHETYRTRLTIRCIPRQRNVALYLTTPNYQFGTPKLFSGFAR